MKIKLLIATGDSDYVEHLSGVLSEKYTDTFEVSVCSTSERLSDLLTVNRFDTVLIEQGFVTFANLTSVPLTLILWDDLGSTLDTLDKYKKIRKYQRISSIAGSILEGCADIVAGVYDGSKGRARITVVWSPYGGTGKTTVSLAYAANKVSDNKETLYLNLENFTSTSVYFSDTGKSISAAFEKLESNIQMFLMGIRQKDSGSGILYFNGPDNYDDINILTANDIETLINACAVGVDELVIDLSSQCDQRVQKIFDLADTILLVSDSSSTSQVKLRQFINQHNIFGRIQTKIVHISNKGAKSNETSLNKEIQLPFVQVADSVSVYKTLSGSNFEW